MRQFANTSLTAAPSWAYIAVCELQDILIGSNIAAYRQIGEHEM